MSNDHELAPVRPATLSDSSEVIRLARLMYEAMGLAGFDDGWQMVAARSLEERLGNDVGVFVVDDTGVPGRLAASGAASIARRLPGPTNSQGKVGYIQWVSTDPRWRRRGMARAVTKELIGWLRQQGVHRIELHATQDGEALYRSLGFGNGQNPRVRIRI